MRYGSVETCRNALLKKRNRASGAICVRQCMAKQKNMADLVLKNLKKEYAKGIIAVDDFNLEIKDQEFIVLVGPSGCGKSTTLRMIAGLESITSGELYIGGVLCNDIAPKDRDIAMVFQNYALYPHMTVYENMAFALKLRKVSKEEIDRKVKEAAAILGITEYLDRRPKALSGGQRQRVAIGRAIVRHPKIFLMDEPLSNLDAKLRNQMRAEIIKLREKINTTFVYVTHDQIEAMTLGDRIVIMKDGFINQIGTPQQVFNDPINIYVARFIGSPHMNLFDGKLLKEEDTFFVCLYGKKIKLPEEKQRILRTCTNLPEDIVVGVRPEHTFLDEDGITAKIDVREMMGSEVYLHVDVQGTDAVLKLPVTLENERKIKECSACGAAGFGFEGEYIHIFDKETSLSLTYHSNQE